MIVMVRVIVCVIDILICVGVWLWLLWRCWFGMVLMLLVFVR